MAVFTLYAEAISYPYMKMIRSPSENNKDEAKNMLNLGPLHAQVYKHIMDIIEDPNILIGSSTTPKIAMLDGEKWQNPAVVEKILNEVHILPYFLELLHAFFNGAAETWERFTSEFAPGGLIDAATAEERDLAWVPPTNDENEGALGSFRILM